MLEKQGGAHCWSSRHQGSQLSNGWGLKSRPPSSPTPTRGTRRGCVAATAGSLTQVVGAAQMEGVAAVHVVVQGLLNQVLRFIPRQLGHSVESNPLRMSAGCGGVPHPKQPPETWVPTLTLQDPQNGLLRSKWIS